MVDGFEGRSGRLTDGSEPFNTYEGRQDESRLQSPQIYGYLYLEVLERSVECAAPQVQEYAEGRTSRNIANPSLILIRVDSLDSFTSATLGLKQAYRVVGSSSPAWSGVNYNV